MWIFGTEFSLAKQSIFTDSCTYLLNKVIIYIASHMSKSDS